MGEIIVACFIGVWLTAAGIAAHKRLKKDYETIGGKTTEGKKR